MGCNQIINEVINRRQEIKNKKPLIHHITNYVTANDSANITLSMGASPVMVNNPEEITEIIQTADVLVLNTGTMQSGQERVFFKVVKIANKKGLPIVLDPVGVGAISLRKKLVIDLIKNYKIDIIKGNIAEIKSIAGMAARAKGVDSEDDEEGVVGAAEKLAEKHNMVVAVTGERDIVVDGQRSIKIENGHSLLASVTGTGCMTASLIGAFAATGMDKFYAAVGGVLTMGIAGELAAAQAAGPGTLHYKLMDEIYYIDRESYKSLAKIDI
ncbi:MAG: hydroxyethylthiazole kinase [Halanaerobiaceae bacterium]